MLDIALSEEFDYIELFPVSDLHLGSRLCNLPKFRKFTNMILAEPNRFIILNGDLINNNVAGAVGSPFEDDMTPREQKRALKEELKPLKERILVIVSGNHERRTKKTNDENPLEDVAEYLERPYREEECFLKLSLGKGANGKRIAYSIFVTHGSGGGKRPGSSLNNIELLSLSVFAEIYILGHVHKKTAHKAGIRVPDLHNNQIRTVDQLYVISSSYQSYGGYAAQKMLRPSALGSVPIYLSGTEKYYEARI